jgi:hypothetical protein
MHKCCIMSKNIFFFYSVIERTFPYSIAEGGGNCVPMYLNKCSEIGKKDAENYGEEDALIKQAICQKNLEKRRKLSCVGGWELRAQPFLKASWEVGGRWEVDPPSPHPKTASLAGPKQNKIMNSL